MKKLFRHILSLVLLFLYVFPICAQEKSHIDEELERYEALCGICLDMKDRISDGEGVSKGEAQALIGRFVAMNHKIKSRSDHMTPQQKRRFEAVGIWFSTGKRPLSLNPEVSVEPLSSKFNICAQKMAVETLDVSSQLDSLQNSEICNQRNRRTLSIYLLAGLTVPDLSYGLMAGAIYGRWGGYVNFKSNFLFMTPSYTCYSSGMTEEGWMFWPGGGTKNSNLIATLGGLYAPYEWLSIYLGAGYGHRKLYWEDSQGKWAEVSDWSYSGFSSEAGAIFSWNKWAFSVGVSTVSFRTAVCSLGVGISF